jgi:TM2 domain-containing membrane protein YozV
MDNEIIKSILAIIFSLIGVYKLYNDQIFLNIIYSQFMQNFINILAFIV